jgi:hypothetical protein
MVFIIFLVSLGTIHVILAADKKQKREKEISRRARTAITPVVEAPGAPAEATPGVWTLLRAVEDHGRGEKPGTDIPKVPTATKSAHGDC